MDAELRRRLARAEAELPRPRCRGLDLAALHQRVQVRARRRVVMALGLLLAIGMTLRSWPTSANPTPRPGPAEVAAEVERWALGLRIAVLRERAAAAELWTALRAPDPPAAIARVADRFPRTPSAERAARLLSFTPSIPR